MDSIVIQPLSSDGSVSVLQLTDTHLFAEEGSDLLGVQTSRSFEEVVKAVGEQAVPCDFAAVTGDISQDYSPESYQRFAGIVSPLKLPIFFLPGNHDDGPLMYRMFQRLGINTAREVLCGKWQFIFLNSEVYNVAHGWVQRDQLDFMHHCLAAHPDFYTVICVHHPPFNVQSEWLDSQNMHNQDEFMSDLAMYRQIRLLLCGHVHQEVDLWRGDLRIIASPSTSIQFAPQSGDFELDRRPPGWRYLNFGADGQITTQVHRLSEGSFCPDMSAQGY